MGYKDPALAPAADPRRPLEHLAAYMAPPLVSAEAKERLLDLARRLPTTSGAMIECRLGLQVPQVDLSLRATKADGGRDLLAEFEPASVGGPSAVWPKVRDFCHLWQQRGSVLDRFVENIWLEFDLPTATAFVPEPCVFFDSIDSDGEQTWISSVALAVLLPGVLPETVCRNLGYCCAARPRQSTVHYVGAMLGRRTHNVRLTLRMRRSEVLPYLRDLRVVGWRGPHSLIGEVVNALPRFASELVLNIDVGGVVAPGVGIEIHPATSREWNTLLDTLVLQRSATDAQRRAMPGWPGSSPELGDDGLAGEIALKPSPTKQTVMVVRRLNHVKLVIDTDMSVLSKVYLYGGFGWA